MNYNYNRVKVYKKTMLTKTKIENAISNSPWDLANNTLYDLCKQYPKHNNNEEIIAKVWTIGRTYSAAIERRKSGGKFQGDDFYVDRVAPHIIKSPIDEWFFSLKDIESLDQDSLTLILETHCKVTNLFEDITNDKKNKKRSLSSKYLHFHFPELFFIYDSRAEKGVKKLSEITGRARRYDGVADNVYRKFCEKCLIVRDHIKEQYGKTLTPRQLDKLLLDQ